MEELFEQLHGKELSYNNLIDVDAALGIIADFEDPTFVVIKHNNSCGLATRENLLDAWKAALAGDPVSAFGGIISTNRKLDKETAEAINELFIEVLLAPDYDADALEVLKSKKNIRILKTKKVMSRNIEFRTALNGVIWQDRNNSTQNASDLTTVTKREPTEQEVKDMLFANIAVKHLKSNTIVLVKDRQLLSMGCGQTSRVDSLQQAIAKAAHFEFDLNGAVMASDAFFPFPDCVEIASKAGITAVIQPGGSIKDQQSIDFCDSVDMAMMTTGVRHFKH